MTVNKRQDGDCYTFKASQIRRGLSLATILSKLNANEEKEQQRTFNSQLHQIQMEQPRENTRSERQVHNEPSIGIHSLGLFDTSNPVYDPAEEEFRRRMQKKKRSVVLNCKVSSEPFLLKSCSFFNLIR